MRSRVCRAAVLVPALAVLSALGAAPAATEPHPETQLLTALDDLSAGRVNEAWQSLDGLVKRQPNFRLAQLFHGELRAARNGGSVPRDLLSLASMGDPQMQDLVEEGRLRLRQWREPRPAGTAPDLILQLADTQKHAVLVDLPRGRLFLLEQRDGTLQVSRHYYASIGKNGWGKSSTGDNRTPVGVYRITGFIEDPQLPELYGAGAFPVNYPNAWDRRLKHTGSGIWLHGVPRDTYSRPPRSSEGCVTLANADLMELKPHFVPGETPVLFSDVVNWVPGAELEQRRREFFEQLGQWRTRWAARDTEGYLDFYADDFETDGMGKSAFAAYKRRVNRGKSFIEVRLSDVELFRYPGQDDLWLASFTQHYRSDNYSKTSRKDQYWRRGTDGRWQIVKEASR